MARESRGIAGRVFGILLALILAAGVAALFFFRQDLGDLYRASTFDPSPRIEEVMEAIELTDRGERLFLATHPTIEGSQHFTEQCAGVDHSDDGHLLGCYTDDRIRLFDVDDERISGVVDVTAAHELLHAAYARLGAHEQTDLQKRLVEVYEGLIPEDPVLAERMSLYQDLPQERFANELHSVLGTEVAELPQDLEEHYSRWFANRPALIERFQSFRGVFDEIAAQVETLKAEMDALRTSIEQGSEDYSAAVTQFNTDVNDLNARNQRYEFSDAPEEFERIRADLTERRAGLEGMYGSLQADIERYNGLREQLIALGEVSEELDAKLDATLAPVGE